MARYPSGVRRGGRGQHWVRGPRSASGAGDRASYAMGFMAARACSKQCNGPSTASRVQPAPRAGSCYYLSGQTTLVREAMRLSTVLLRQLAVIAYGVIYFTLASSMEAQNVQQGYPLAYVLPSMLAQTFVVCGIFLFALNTSGEFARIWQWLFPLLIAELAAGMVVDVTHAADALDIVPDELFSVWFVAPAYYFNFKVARYRR